MSATANWTGSCATTRACVVIEHFNARHLTLADLPGPVDLVIDRRVVHLSAGRFFRSSRRYCVPEPTSSRWSSRSSRPGAPRCAKGIIRDPAIHARVLDEVAAAGAEVGLSRVASTPSPITGQKGNVEFLVHFRPS